MSHAKALLDSRRKLHQPPFKYVPQEAEGGCGVVGLVASRPIRGSHILQPLEQMHNRGNGKGGGISAVGLVPEQLGVDRKTLEQDYLVQVAYLKEDIREQLEKEFIFTTYDVHVSHRVATSDDPALLDRLEVAPPVVHRYFCRAKKEVLDRFVQENALHDVDRRRAEDELVYQTSFQINKKYYAGTSMSAFVMSQGRNMLIMKIVGYAEDVIHYYKLEDFQAHMWIGHQRYPTKGRVWHPGGAHPFMGLDEALVHNGDFANYYSMTEYLGQKGITPLFLTDTEVSVLLFDLLNRVYGYPLEYILEALAPTTERDFHLLSEEKQKVYLAIQSTHLHRSPDGPWFFIISRNDYYEDRLQLIGITDTSMLRPQVFALVEGEVQVGLIASEKQAIDSSLRSLSTEFRSVPQQADVYWNARGGSHTDGGAFVFTLGAEVPGNGRELVCTNKFGARVSVPGERYERQQDAAMSGPLPQKATSTLADRMFASSVEDAFRFWKEAIVGASAEEAMGAISSLSSPGSSAEDVERKLAMLTLAMDRRFSTGRLRRSRMLSKLNEGVNALLHATSDQGFVLVDLKGHRQIHAPREGEKALVIDCEGFPMEGVEGISHLICRGVELGWKRIILIGTHGQRFLGCGLGPGSKGIEIEVYGSSGDYLASGLDGASIAVHGNAQDQLGQILNSGKLVVHGDVGQTFMYGAKGGEVFILGNAAGRPLINAVGKPRVVINGTCLDYLAESFMAGDPLNGGGFVILNALGFDGDGRAFDLPEPYPGGNLFSLASGGAIYVRDPKGKVGEDQLNGGRIVSLAEKDWETILPYLRENERLFGISVEDVLLRMDGVRVKPWEIYKKVEVVPLSAPSKGEPVEEDSD